MISDNYLENLGAVLLAYAILAFLVERGLYQIFDSKLWRGLEKWIDTYTSDAFDLKPWISLGICAWLTFEIRLDMVAELYQKEQSSIGTFLTAAFIAGGSTGVYKTLRRARQMREEQK